MCLRWRDAAPLLIMIEVLKPGLETCIQDYPGRKGAFGMGFPPSGPIDHWSFRLANLLVGNTPGDAALECQFIGPALKFKVPTIFALTGGDMRAKLDGARVPLWQSVAAKTGQKLELESAIVGARCYIAFAGGIDTPPFLGSRSTFVLGECGGLDGAPLAVGGRVFPGAESSRSVCRPFPTLASGKLRCAPDRTTIGSTRRGRRASWRVCGSSRPRATVSVFG